MKHSETEKDYIDKESVLLKEVSVAEFELNGLIQVAGNYCLWFPFSVLKYFVNSVLYLVSFLIAGQLSFGQVSHTAIVCSTMSMN